MTATKEVKIGILGASLETPNLGVSVLATGAVRCALNAYPYAEVFFLDYAKERSSRQLLISGRRICVPLINMRFSKHLWLPNHIAVLLLLAILLRALPCGRFRQWVMARNTCLRAIASADQLCAIAGGDSFSDLYGSMRFLYCALPQLLVILLRKPLILLPQTYGPFRRPALRRIAQWMVRHAERAWCRDGQSLAALMGEEGSDQLWGARASCYDLGFVLESTPPVRISIEGFAAPSERDSHLVGLNVSGLLYRGGYTGKNEFGLQCSYARLVRTVAELLLCCAGTRLLLVPHVFGNDPESDVRACESVYQELREAYPGRVAVLRGEYGPGEIRHVIGLCGFFVGSRMHACIAAVSQGIASLSIAYGDKFAGVMRTLGVDGLVADARSLSQLEVLARVQEGFQKRMFTAHELETRLPHVRDRVLNLFAREPVPQEMQQRTPVTV